MILIIFQTMIRFTLIRYAKNNNTFGKTKFKFNEMTEAVPKTRKVRADFNVRNIYCYFCYLEVSEPK